MEQLKVARAAAMATQRTVEQQQAEVKAQQQQKSKGLKPGDPGYRWHASIPMASR